MDKITLKTLGKMAVVDQVKTINEGIKAAGGKKEFYEQNDLKANSVNSHMKKLGYITGRKSTDLFVAMDDKITQNNEQKINNNKVIVSDVNNLSNDINLNVDDNNLIINDSNKISNNNNENVIDNNNNVINNNKNISKNEGENAICDDEKWANMDAKALLKARKEVFSVVVDALEDINMDNKATTSLSMYKDAADALDLFAKTFKQSKQDVVSAAIMQFINQFK